VNDTEDLLRRSLASIAPPAPLAPWHEIERRARLGRRPRLIRRALAVGVLVAALTGALLIGSSGGSGPSALQRASAAVADWPAGAILHTQIHMVSNFPQADHFEESWQLTSPPYTRHTRSWFGTATPSDPIVESVTDAVGFGQGYDWRSNVIDQTDDVPVYWREQGVSQSTREDMQSWVSNSHAKSLGESEVDGHRVVGFEAWGSERIFVDAQTYLPVLTQSFGMGVGPQRRGYDEHYTWDLLPASPQNRGLLDLTQVHPGASVSQLGSDAWRQAEMELGRLLPALIVPGV
jgi:hypothetical protein